LNVAVVLLAAGASSRLGEPKALAEIGGTRVLARMLTAVDDGLGALSTRPLVVTGAHHGPIAAFLAEQDARPEVAFHPGWALGRTTSVQAAARLRPEQDMLLWPVDVPLVSAAVLRSIVHEWDSLGQPANGWLAPSLGPSEVPATKATGMERGPGMGPRFGHPILLGAGLTRMALGLGPDAPLRQLRQAADPLATVLVMDDAILDDLDTPGDLARLRSKMG
jgi:molybdenum cofactor cytidylyltransferase